MCDPRGTSQSGGKPKEPQPMIMSSCHGRAGTLCRLERMPGLELGHKRGKEWPGCRPELGLRDYAQNKELAKLWVMAE